MSAHRFSMDRLLATPNALSQLTHHDIMAALRRHAIGDWGDLDEHDRCENETSLVHGLRLLSVYTGANGTRFYVITEADRSVTTVLLPEDY